MNENYPNEKNGFGLASLILGAAAVLLFGTCINFILIILAIIFGVIQLSRSQKKAMAVTGIVLSGVSLVLSIVLWVVVLSHIDFGSVFDSDDFFDYDFSDDYDNDYDYDFNFGDNYDDDHDFDFDFGDDYDHDYDYDFGFPDDVFPGDEYSVPDSGIRQL
jgi:hypothetical protein